MFLSIFYRLLHQKSKVKRITKHKKEKPYLLIFHRYGKALQKTQRDFPLQNMSNGAVQHVDIDASIQNSL